MPSLWKNPGVFRRTYDNYLRTVRSWFSSDATKDRFIAMYHVADKAPARSCELFNGTVLEFVKLIQASLAIFGMFELHAEERDGLLCDMTCEGMRRWANQIGGQYIHSQVPLVPTFR